MDKIKNAYFYFFYKLYKFGARSGPFPNDFSAAVLIVILEVLVLGVLKFYYISFIDPSDSIRPLSFETIAPLLAVFLSIIYEILLAAHCGHSFLAQAFTLYKFPYHVR